MKTIEEPVGGTRTVKIVDYHDVINFAKNLVLEKGDDYKYKDEYGICENFAGDGDTVGKCIVGRFFASVGLRLHQCGNGDVTGSLQNLATYQEQHPEEDRVRFTPDAVIALRIMQINQDDGGTWKTGYMAAEAWLFTRNNLNDAKEFGHSITAVIEYGTSEV